MSDMDSERGWTLLFWAMMIIGVLAVLFRSDDVERDLADRANAALHGNALQWASVKNVRGRNLYLTGEAPVKAQQEWPRNMVEDLYGVRKVNDEAVSVKGPAVPYVWAAIVTPEEVTLTGSVPDEETRASIREKVENIISDRKVTDQMVLADGAPETGWLENINNILKYTKYLKNGAVHLTDRAVKVEGEAWNALDFEVVALRASRGRTVNDYAFSSDLRPPAGVSGQILNTIAPSQAGANDEADSAQPEKTEDKTIGQPDEKNGESSSIAVTGKTETSSGKDVQETRESETEKKDKEQEIAPETTIPEDGPSKSVVSKTAPAETQKGTAAIAPAVPASRPDKDPASAEPSSNPETTKAPAVEEETPVQDSKNKSAEEKPKEDRNASASEAGSPPASDRTPEPETAAKKKTGSAQRKQPSKSPAVANPRKQAGQRVAPARIPPYLIAPPWAFSPSSGYYRPPPAYYPAPRIYAPNCAYGYPYAPAYCGPPVYQNNY